MSKLSGKKVFITGTSQGIGASIAKALILEGCHIAMHYFHSSEIPSGLRALAQSKNQKAICLKADFTKEQEVVFCIREATQFLGSIDILINNSGSIVKRNFLRDIDNDFWQLVIDLNLTTMMLVTREALPFMNTSEGSSIINMASLAGRKGGHAGSLAYSAAKGAVLSWTRALSAELGPKNIRVNAVAPGFIEGTSFHELHTSRESAQKTIAEIPIGRSGCPEDVARAVIFLASEYDGFITGATLDINGGIYCT